MLKRAWIAQIRTQGSDKSHTVQPVQCIKWFNQNIEYTQLHLRDVDFPQNYAL